jgi:hypothetical protein
MSLSALFVIVSAILFSVGASFKQGGAGAAFRPPGENIARGRAYTLSPPPNYPLCTDEGDSVQLTDGVYTEGYFWTQTSTVGWQSGKPIQIAVDLGVPQPICGISYNTAAGVAGVAWPVAIQIYVSDDGKSWWDAGELVGLSAERGTPPAEGYAVYRFWTGRLKCHGRYVTLQITPGASYAFCDEIEVYRGADDLLRLPREGQPITDLKQAFFERAVSTAVRARILADAAEVRREISTAKLPDAERSRLLSELDAAEKAAFDFRAGPDFLAVLPYGAAHSRVMAARAAVWRAAGMKATVWQTGPWDPLQPGDAPPSAAPPPAIDMLMLRNEIRGAVLNITNPTDRMLTLKVRFQGLPGGVLPGWLTVREVAWTGTAAGPPVASVLPDAKRAPDGCIVQAPPGMTRQIWLSVDSATLKPGLHRGKALVTAEGRTLAAVPFTVRISRLRMPDKLALSLGGWDYTDTPTYGITATNMAATVAFLKRYHLDAPWANAGVMPFGRHDADGRMVEPPDTRRMDEWIARWKGARYYFVFNSFGEELPDTPSARRRVEEWINFWVGHLASRGIRPSQLGLLLVDEPREPQMDRTIVSYAKVIREAQPDVIIFEDPIWPDPRQASPELYANSTLLCPNRPMWMGNRKVFEEVFLAQQKAGRRLAFYSCSGPVRSLDPYSYHRLQAWDCFRYGMAHMGYWAFGDTGGGSAWNELAAPGTCFAPQFLGPDGCVTSKHMEAIREGLYDHQTLTMLQERVAALEKAGRHDSIVQDAKSLLVEGPRSVTEAKGAESIMWATPKDRSLADRVRRRVIEMLEKLNP